MVKEERRLRGIWKAELEKYERRPPLSRAVGVSYTPSRSEPIRFKAHIVYLHWGAA